KINTKISSETNKRLKHVFVIHRHGERTPDYTYPNDPYGSVDKYWPDGWQQLTKKGKQRMYSLGKYIRKRYKNFLGDSPREVYARSSSKDRCLESVGLVLSALYPPVGRWKWDGQLGQHWQPIPIITVRFCEDGMLNPRSYCPTADRDRKQISKSKPVNELMAKHRNLLQYVSDKCGVQLDDWSAGMLYNTLEIQKLHNLGPIGWLNQTIYRMLREFHEMVFIFDANTRLQKRLRAGLLLKDITDRMRQSISDRNYSHKIALYSTHDIQVALLLNTLNVYDKRNIRFGATIIIELYQLNDRPQQQQYGVEVYYLNVTESEQPYKLYLNRCHQRGGQVCHLDDFVRSVQTYIPDNWLDECRYTGGGVGGVFNIKLEL
ncbi:prostatic acid phosphatase-like, partial [Oppia nitens]|uniref:prostatic acid phosphatase-like n=1 Tax=Oppia nitens TaxID=1686743 RepID=UPI0023DAA2BC